MSRPGELLHDEPMRLANRRARRLFDVAMRGSTLGRALAAIVVGSVLLLPALADAVPQGAKRVLAPAPAASAVSSAEGARPRVSPYTIAARQHAQAASSAGHAPAVPPSMRRTHQAIGQVQQH
jgi:hypothetical protein